MVQDKIIKEIKENLRMITEKQKETDQEIASLSKELKNVGEMVGKMTDGWGRVVEGLVVSSVPVIFKRLGIDVFYQTLRSKRYKDGKELEIDILCLGKDRDGEEMAIISEVKSDVSSKDIDEFLADLDQFKYFFDEYRDKRAIGVIAGMRFGKGAQRYAEKCGLYVLGPSGEVMELLTKPDFKPKIWR
ncbi:MAG: hypothetical protein QME40_06775 [bacterium]|nr:hypothetical protein [bacterium]